MSKYALKRCRGREYYCTVELTLNIIGGKWKPIILYHLSDGEPQRFGELKKSMPNITQKMLTQQLRELEHDGLVLRRVYAEVPPRVEYSLTTFGLTILPVLHSLSQWGSKYENMHQENPEIQENLSKEPRCTKSEPERVSGGT